MAERDNKGMQYVCNFKGMKQRAWPTLREGSYAFRIRDGQPRAHMVWDSMLQQWTEPIAQEQERAMGFPMISTTALGIGEATRCRLMGNAIHINALSGFIQVGIEYAMYGRPTQQTILIKKISSWTPLNRFSSQKGGGARIMRWLLGRSVRSCSGCT